MHENQPADAPRSNSSLVMNADPPKEVSALRKIFFGPNGLRAGWRLLIYVSIAASIIVGVHFVRHHTTHAQPRPRVETAWPAAINEWLGFGIFLFAAWVLSRIERQPWGHYGLPLRYAFRRRFWQGALFGFAGLSCVMGCLRLAHCYYIDGLRCKEPRSGSSLDSGCWYSSP